MASGSTLVAVAKDRGMATVLVGHVTKDGNVAGPRVLEHLVDVVLQFEGDKHSSLRMVRGLKNRFGAADEVGCFEMHEGGISSLPDPSGLFITRYAAPVAGTCVTVAMEGRRALVTEVQALLDSLGVDQARDLRPSREFFGAGAGGIHAFRANREGEQSAAGGSEAKPAAAAAKAAAPSWTISAS